MLAFVFLPFSRSFAKSGPAPEPPDAPLKSAIEFSATKLRGLRGRGNRDVRREVVSCSKSGSLVSVLVASCGLSNSCLGSTSSKLSRFGINNSQNAIRYCRLGI